jgi:general L-amino acid transport system substrate-binding protein
VIDGDSRWADAVNWAIFATIQAEEFGVTSENAADMAAGDDPTIAAFLGAPNEDGTTFDAGLGLAPDFALTVVSQVGNYGEIFEANLPAIGVEERGLNALWSDGGLQYAPPYR